MWQRVLGEAELQGRVYHELPNHRADRGRSFRIPSTCCRLSDRGKRENNCRWTLPLFPAILCTNAKYVMSRLLSAVARQRAHGQSPRHPGVAWRLPL